MSAAANGCPNGWPVARSHYTDMTLFTFDVLDRARRIYQRAGFELAEEHPQHSFGKDLVGQDRHVPAAAQTAQLSP